MPGGVMDVRAVATKLLRAHKMHLLNSDTTQDPQLPDVKVVTIKFTRRENQNPKAFFDSLNENGIQYSKQSKDPNATTIICELWRKGDKKRVTELRKKAKDRERKRDKGTSEGPVGGGTSSPYIGPPNLGTGSVLVMSQKEVDKTAEALLASGYAEEAVELLKIAGEQGWEVFSKVLTDSLTNASIKDSPEARLIRERVSRFVVEGLGSDASLLKDIRPAELKRRVTECLRENVESIIDMNELSDSLLRRCAETLPAEEDLTTLIKGYEKLAKDSAEGSQEQRKAVELAQGVKNDIYNIRKGATVASTLVFSPIARAILSGSLSHARLLLMEM